MLFRRLLVLGWVYLLIACSSIAQPADAAVQAFPGPVERISNGGGSYTAISANGQFVAFETADDRLTARHVPGSWDTYLYDRQTRQAELVSIGSSGQVVENPGDYTSAPSLSAGGQWVAFMSGAGGLVPEDTNGLPDIFVRDRASGVTRLVSSAVNGGPANGPSFNPALSADGRYVAFQSTASNLVQGDTNDAIDVFVHDLVEGKTELVSVSSSGAQGADPHDYGYSSLSISSDGRFVAFSYQNLPGEEPGSGVYLRDRFTQETLWVAPGEYPRLSPDGRFLVFVTRSALDEQDIADSADVYLFDRQSAVFERISVAAGDGENREAGIFSPPDLSDDGLMVVFETTAALVPGDENGLADVYLRDRRAGETWLLSSTPAGQAGNDESHYPTISDDGSAAAFTSMANNLVAGDENHLGDVFVRNLSTAGAWPENPGQFQEITLFLPAVYAP